MRRGRSELKGMLSSPQVERLVSPKPDPTGKHGIVEKISDIEAVQTAAIIRPITAISERECLARLSAEVRPYGLIVEIGCLYGGMTAVLALSNPRAIIVAIDDFSWHPDDDKPASAALLIENVTRVGAHNVLVQEGDSLSIGKSWLLPIDLLWIDGGHSYQYVFSDLCSFGACAEVVACHDYGNATWPTIRAAVDDFLHRQEGAFYLDEVVETVSILRRAHHTK
jgi:precorrin-6B methylase 2